MINYYTFILLEEVILWLIALNQYHNIVHSNTTILFGHQKKSITDTYSVFCIWIPIHIVFCFFRLFFFLIERKSINLFTLRVIWFINLISFVYNSDIDLYDNRNKTYITL